MLYIIYDTYIKVITYNKVKQYFDLLGLWPKPQCKTQVGQAESCGDTKVKATLA